jgi:hypothetical protein
MFPARQRMNGVEVAEGLLDCVGGLAIFRWSVKPETAEPIAPTTTIQ